MGIPTHVVLEGMHFLLISLSDRRLENGSGTEREKDSPKKKMKKDRKRGLQTNPLRKRFQSIWFIVNFFLLNHLHNIYRNVSKRVFSLCKHSISPSFSIVWWFTFSPGSVIRTLNGNKIHAPFTFYSKIKNTWKINSFFPTNWV